MERQLNVLVVGLGQMGGSHARGYREIAGWNIAGIVARDQRRHDSIRAQFPGTAVYSIFEQALAELKPDAVSINTYPDSHAEYALRAIAAGAHVFVEKPLADTVEAAKEVVAAAQKANRKLVVGYILNHHPSWIKFVELVEGLGRPLVMRMNLLQQSSGGAWEVHKKMLNAGLQPIVDCGIHYVDVMCQMVGRRPTKVNAMSVRLSDEVETDNYGQLQLEFEDGSIGWYEAGYGPSLSETAFFVKDVFGPKGSVSIVNKEMTSNAQTGATASADINSHTQANFLRIHHAELDGQGAFAREDHWVRVEDEPSHEDLCQREQEFFLKAILDDLDLSEHMRNAITSLEIVLAADQSAKTGVPVLLGKSN